MSEHKRRQSILATMAVLALSAGEDFKQFPPPRPLTLREEIEEACREYDSECGGDVNQNSYHFTLAGAMLRLRMREIFSRHPIEVPVDQSPGTQRPSSDPP